MINLLTSDEELFLSKPNQPILKLIKVLKDSKIGFKWSKNLDLSEEITENRENSTDWSGFYLCLDLPTAEGYLVSRLPDDGKGNGTVYMHEMTLKKDVYVLVSYDESFKNGSYKKNNTVNSIKDEINRSSTRIKEYIKNDIDFCFANNDLFLERLGKMEMAFMNYHDIDGCMEIVFPNLIREKYLEWRLFKKYLFRKFEMIDID